MASPKPLDGAILADIKRHRQIDGVKGQETINQIEHMASAGAKLVMSGVLVAGDVITDDISAAAVLVLSGTVCRIQVAADTYVAFSSDPAMPTVSATTTPAVKLLANTINLVVATGDFIRASANPTRLECVMG